MRLALISEHASPFAALGGADAGGQNVYVAQTATLLAKLGHTVDVYTRRVAPDQPETVTLRPGLRIVHVTAGPAEDIAKEDLYQYMPAFAREVMARMGKEGPPDLVHAHFWMSGAVALEIERKLQVPFVVTFHALGKVRRKHQGEADRFPPVRDEIETAIIGKAARVIAECPQDVADLTRLYAADGARLVQIPCGFDPEEMGPIEKRLARELLGIAPNTRVVLQLGRMVPRKGVDDAIRGFARASAAVEEPALMLVVGGEVSDGSVVKSPEGARLAAIAEEEGAANRVRFAGNKSRESLRYFYSAADVFVSVPWYEPFGITPLEAMACGVPVIGSDVGGVKYTVQDGVTGRLVPPHTPDAVAEAIRELLAEEAVRERLGRAGRERVNGDFTWEKVTRQLDAVYSEVARPVSRVDTVAPREAVTLGETANLIATYARRIEPEAERAARLIADTVLTGGTVLVCGNGGSAADAQHMATELIGRFVLERPGVPALALSSDSSVLTAVGNDYGFDQVFARQIEALGHAGDVLLAMSTSGRSPNILKALVAARARSVRTIGLLGGDGGPAKRLCDAPIVVPTTVTARVQEVHQMVMHHFAAAVDEAYAAMLASRDVTLSTPLPQGYFA